jgi:hypothetical protein
MTYPLKFNPDTRRWLIGREKSCEEATSQFVTGSLGKDWQMSMERGFEWQFDELSPPPPPPPPPRRSSLSVPASEIYTHAGEHRPTFCSEQT